LKDGRGRRPDRRQQRSSDVARCDGGAGAGAAGGEWAMGGAGGRGVKIGLLSVVAAGGGVSCGVSQPDVRGCG